MNILRHKKWHVRTKENVARVRRDEAKAAEEEKQRAERAAIAEHEDRIRRLKTRAATSGSGATAASSIGDIFGGGGTEAGTSSHLLDPTKHVNLFAELEEQERKNTTVGNKEYAAEKKKEQDDWESKVGIMKRFAEDTKEYSKESEWWQGIPIVREKIENAPAAEPKKVTQEKFLTKEEKRAKKEEKKRKKKAKRHRRRRSSSSSSNDLSKERKRKKLETLRLERLARERQEQQRVQKLMKPEKEEPQKEAPRTQVEEDRKRKYNSQFNPEFSKY